MLDDDRISSAQYEDADATAITPVIKMRAIRTIHPSETLRSPRATL